MAPSQQPQKALGLAIHQLREKRGMTQEAVAHEAGVTASTLSVIERGHSNPTWATLKDIAAALDVSMVELAKVAHRFERGKSESSSFTPPTTRRKLKASD